MENSNQFIITINEDEAREVEKTRYELDRKCDDIARMLNKDIRFENPGVKSFYEILADRVGTYDKLKDDISEKYVLLKATEKWSNNANVAWELDFHTKNIVVTFTGNDNRTTIPDAITVDDAELCERLQFLSVNCKACEELYDRCISSYPTMDTLSFKEFVSFKEKLDAENKELKDRVENEIAKPWVLENTTCTGAFDWTLKFESRKITITYSPSKLKPGRYNVAYTN